jgi:hypothetical protein
MGAGSNAILWRLALPAPLESLAASFDSQHSKNSIKSDHGS